MKIIALKGDGGTGKSATLNIVYQVMQLFGYIQVPGHYRVLGNPANRDCIDILERRGTLIGIATMGDYQDYTEDAGAGDAVQDLINYLRAQGCEIIICAVNRDLDIAIAFIENLPHVFVDKLISRSADNYALLNALDAESVYRLI